MTLELSVDQFGRLNEKLDTILAEAGEARTEAALQRQALEQIRTDLTKHSNEVATVKDKLTSLRESYIELRGMWKVISAAAAAIRAVAHWIMGRLQ
jgi:chromosome segregation ATPase